jgi:3-oxoacyl-[acyl-carrier protein] reductase
MKLKNKTAIITGANQGFGLEVAKFFAKEGANLLLTARNYEKLIIAKKEVEAVSNSKVEILQVNVANAADNQKTAMKAIDLFGKIDILVANAGIYGPKGPSEEVDWEEWASAIDINLKGAVLSCRSVMEHMKKNRFGKIIILSGGGATKPMPNISAYAVSKAGVVRFAETIAEELKDYNIDVNAVAPGALNTRLLNEILEAGPTQVGKAFYEQSLKQHETGGTSLDKGANLCVYLASEESNGITGKLISAVWDHWESFAEKKDELKNSDIYTLRRIVPEDRNKKW